MRQTAEIPSGWVDGGWERWSRGGHGAGEQSEKPRWRQCIRGPRRHSFMPQSAPVGSGWGWWQVPTLVQPEDLSNGHSTCTLCCFFLASSSTSLFSFFNCCGETKPGASSKATEVNVQIEHDIINSVSPGTCCAPRWLSE